MPLLAAIACGPVDPDHSSAKRTDRITIDARLAVEGEFDWLPRQLNEFPQDPSWQNNLAYSLAQRGENLDHAYDLITAALAAEPEDPVYMDTMAWVLHRQGLQREAMWFIQGTLDRQDQLYGEQKDIARNHLRVVVEAMTTATSSGDAACARPSALCATVLIPDDLSARPVRLVVRSAPERYVASLDGLTMTAGDRIPILVRGMEQIAGHRFTVELRCEPEDSEHDPRPFRAGPARRPRLPCATSGPVGRADGASDAPVQLGLVPLVPSSPPDDPEQPGALGLQ
jgi:hypothetical protein